MTDGVSGCRHCQPSVVANEFALEMLGLVVAVHLARANPASRKGVDPMEFVKRDPKQCEYAQIRHRKDKCPLRTRRAI